MPPLALHENNDGLKRPVENDFWRNALKGVIWQRDSLSRVDVYTNSVSIGVGIT